jgi:hypothetical protein
MVSVATRLRAGRLRVRISVGARNFFFVPKTLKLTFSVISRSALKVYRVTITLHLVLG